VHQVVVDLHRLDTEAAFGVLPLAPTMSICTPAKGVAVRAGMANLQPAGG